MTVTQAKLIIKAGLWPTGARRVVAAHNNGCHRGRPTAHVEVDPDYTYQKGPPQYRVFCYECAELMADDETKGDSSG